MVTARPREQDKVTKVRSEDTVKKRAMLQQEDRGQKDTMTYE